MRRGMVCSFCGLAMSWAGHGAVAGLGLLVEVYGWAWSWDRRRRKVAA